jgi:hypothetical protein
VVKTGDCKVYKSKSGDQRHGKRRIGTFAIRSVVIVSAITGVAYLYAPAQGASEPVNADSDEISATSAPENPPSHMARPDSGYRMYVAYFEEYQTGDAMNQDVTYPIKLAADDVKKNGLSLVITCHGDDAIAGNARATEHDFKLGRFQTIRDDLMAQGLTWNRIKNEWNDPVLAAAAAKEGPKSRADKPNCYIETAVPTSLD